MILDTLETYEFTCIQWSDFFQASLLIRILSQFQTKISYGHVMKIPRDDGLLSEPTTEVNGNDP